MLSFVADVTIASHLLTYRAASSKVDVCLKYQTKRKLSDYINGQIQQHQLRIGEIDKVIADKQALIDLKQQELDGAKVKQQALQEALSQRAQALVEDIEALTLEGSLLNQHQIELLSEQLLQINQRHQTYQQLAQQQNLGIQRQIRVQKADMANDKLARKGLASQRRDAEDMLKQVNIQIQIIDAEYELNLHQANVARQKAKTTGSKKFQGPISIDEITSFCTDIKELDALNERLAEIYEKLAKLYQELAGSLLSGNLSGYIAALESDYQSCCYKVNSLEHRKEKAEEFFPVTDQLTNIADEFERINREHRTKVVSETKVEGLKAAFASAKTKEERASLCLKIAEHYYNQALRLRYISSDDLSLADQQFAEHTLYLQKAREHSEQVVRKYTNKHRFLARTELFDSPPKNIIEAIQQSFFIWFNPASFVKALVEFNRECNFRARNKSTEDMYRKSGQAFTYLMKQYDTKTLIKLDIMLRRSKAFTSFLELLGWLTSRPEKMNITYSDSKVASLQPEFALQLSSMADKSMEQKINELMGVILFNIAKLVYAMLDALKNELESRHVFHGDYTFRFANEFSADEDLDISWYQQYCLTHIVHGFSHKNWSLLDVEPPVAEVGQGLGAESAHATPVSVC